MLRAPLLPLVLAVIVGLVSAYALLLLFAFDAPDFKLPAKANVASPVIVAATLVAGALTAAYAVLRLRAHLLAEERGRLDANSDERADQRHRSDQELAFVERFSKAVALLAAVEPISRTAGAHLILSLGDEWPSGAQRCLDVLISHLRGLREKYSFAEDETGSRGVREEVRLITSEVFRRLSANGPLWSVRAGDFSGTALSTIDLNEVAPVAILDLRGAFVLGDLTISAGASAEVPRLAGMLCEGDLTLQWDENWGLCDVSRMTVRGSATILGKSMIADFNGSEMQVGGSLAMSFDAIRGNITLDLLDVQGDVAIGTPELGAEFGVDGTPVDLSLVDASFGRLLLRRFTRGPRLNLSGARGAVDLSSSVFPFEVNASKLDATTGFHLRGARFHDAFVLDEAKVPGGVDLDGLFLSDVARSALQSSEFVLRDRMLGVGGAQAPSHNTEPAGAFDWQGAIQPLREQAGPGFMAELEARLTRVAGELPLDWRSKTSFEAHVMSEVARAAAHTEAPEDAVHAVRVALRRLLASSEGETGSHEEVQ